MQQIQELTANLTSTLTYTINNQVYGILLGGAVPDYLMGTVDDTFYTHYST